MSGELAPWWVAIASGICVTLVGAIGKLWAETARLRRELDDARQANIVLQQETFRAHRHDLRLLVGLPDSLNPSALPLDPLRPPVLVREAAPRPAPKPRIVRKKPGNPPP